MKPEPSPELRDVKNNKKLDKLSSSINHKLSSLYMKGKKHIDTLLKINEIKISSTRLLCIPIKIPLSYVKRDF